MADQNTGRYNQLIEIESSQPAHPDLSQVLDESSAVIVQEPKPVKRLQLPNGNPIASTQLNNSGLSKPPRKLEPIASRTKGEISQPQIINKSVVLKPSHSTERINKNNNSFSVDEDRLQ